MWSLAVAAPFVAALTLVPGPGVFVLMALIGLTMEANFYPLALAAQNAVPRHVGFSAGVTLGVSIGVGAGISALLGVLADARGLTAALVAIAGIELLACGLALLVPAQGLRPLRRQPALVASHCPSETRIDGLRPATIAPARGTCRCTRAPGVGASTRLPRRAPTCSLSARVVPRT